MCLVTFSHNKGIYIPLKCSLQNQWIHATEWDAQLQRTSKYVLGPYNRRHILLKLCLVGSIKVITPEELYYKLSKLLALSFNDTFNKENKIMQNWAISKSIKEMVYW